jgi:hypothetical protein
MYIDKSGVHYDNIVLLLRPTSEYQAGWYYSDEVDQLNGPYGTLEEAVLDRDYWNAYINQIKEL